MPNITVFDRETIYLICMKKPDLVLSKMLSRVIFAVLPIDGFIFGSSLLTSVGIKAARYIGQGISADEVITDGVKVFSSETPVFGTYAAVLMSHCESKWSDPVCPYSTIGANIMRPLVDDTDSGEVARREFITKLIPPASETANSIKCLVLVVSEAQSLLLPQTFCSMLGIMCEKNDSAPGALNYRSITVDIAEKKMRYDLIDEDRL